MVKMKIKYLIFDIKYLIKKSILDYVNFNLLIKNLILNNKFFINLIFF
jgi:hypothetical protein